ncbi:MAG: RlmE family RNA methyltransferase [Rhodospirillales bacterium]|nr:RlmE family RNA methyltransferase [Rhodospirillales bacterium]
MRNKAKTRVKTAKGRKTSSKRWLERQLNDPYVREAERQGLRSRAAFKIMEMDDKLDMFKSGQVVIDLGAAPGGWSQYAADKGCKVVAIDLLPMDELAGVTFFQMDFTDDDAPETLIRATGEGVDIVMSDMAPNTIGHKQTDHIRIMALVEMAYDFATQVLKPDGTFVAKVFQGGAENTLLAQMKKDFKTVRHIKPPASRKESSEQYVVATGYRAETS